MPDNHHEIQEVQNGHWHCNGNIISEEQKPTELGKRPNKIVTSGN